MNVVSLYRSTLLLPIRAYDLAQSKLLPLNDALLVNKLRHLNRTPSQDKLLLLNLLTPNLPPNPRLHQKTSRNSPHRRHGVMCLLIPLILLLIL
uniref:Uncharacterized protein n=1 Tax=Picea glauca TaxID=3330 RepID=A0A101LUF6_PICGL|nr:hypothetical protein ABT39_MTgene2392 [Picea glauca]QHR88979.1 hypothetical protein Q903MT_gene2998 [Picea sitchensis]